jgi:hypothetical protein
VTPSRAPSSLEAVRLELARILGRKAFPATARELARALRRHQAPDALVEALERLPHQARYGNVQELAEAVTGAGEARPRQAARADTGGRSGRQNGA